MEKYENENLFFTIKELQSRLNRPTIIEGVCGKETLFCDYGNGYGTEIRFYNKEIVAILFFNRCIGLCCERCKNANFYFVKNVIQQFESNANGYVRMGLTSYDIVMRYADEHNISFC